MHDTDIVNTEQWQLTNLRTWQLQSKNLPYFGFGNLATLHTSQANRMAGSITASAFN